MEINKIDLYKYFNITRPEGGLGYLTTYVREEYDYCPDRTRPAMLVLAGGGYNHISNREKEIIALKFATEGFQTFTLDYSLTPVKAPAQLIEGCMAIAYIRENAKRLHIIEDKIGAIGFSAGGHLCGTIATLYDSEVVKNALKEKALLCRPDVVVLSYAVITSGEKSHGGSFQNICGEDEKLKEFLSVEKHVNEKTPPAFIWTTVTDQCVPSENSLMIASAYKKAGVPFELHMFSDGVHGLSLANGETATGLSPDLINVQVQPWFGLLMTFLKKKGFTVVNNVQGELKLEYYML